MSYICGIVNWKTNSADASDLASVTSELADVGGHEGRIWSDGPAALGFQETFAGNGLGNSPLPGDDVQSGLSITCDARLDNRGELCSALSVARSSISDAELILRAFQKWGTDCPNHLLGDFAFAIWNLREHRLFATRDAFGVKPFYYHASSERFVFASDLLAVLKADGVSRDIDMSFLAVSVFSFQAKQPAEGTVYTDVRRLAPGHSIIAESNRTKISPWWNPDSIPENRFEKTGDYIDQLRELLVQAVTCRLPIGGSVATHLSGGLDSSSVTVLAARAQRKRGQKLHALFWGPAVRTGGYLAEDERELVDEISRNEDVSCQFTPPTMMQLARWRIRSAGDRPASISCREVIVRRLAAEHGAHVILSGAGGNCAVSLDPRRHQLDYLFRREFWLVLRRETQKRVQYHGGRVWPIYLRRLRGEWIRGRWRQPDLSHAPMREQVLSCLQPEFAASLDLPAIEDEVPKDVRAAQLRLLTDGRMATQLEGWAAEGNADGFEYRFPLLDRRVVEFALGLPQEMHCQRGWYRFLFRSAMDGILPDQARWRIGFYEPGVNHDRKRLNSVFGPEALWPVFKPLMDTRRQWQCVNPTAVRQSQQSENENGQWLGPLLALRVEMLLDAELEAAVQVRLSEMASQGAGQ